MVISANGKERQFPEGLTVEGLLVLLSLPRDSVVVERNGEALPRSEMGSVHLADGDRLEIVKAVAGG